MSKNFLVTTGLAEVWNFSEKNYILGTWCEFHEDEDYQKKKSKNEISVIDNKNHWSDIKKRNKDYLYLQKQLEYLLELFSEILPKVHNVNEDKEYWSKWFPADFVVECFPGQFRNWFYSLLAMAAVMEKKPPFKTLLGHALVKDETGQEMHKSSGNAIWFEDAAEKMGVDVMRWLYAGQNPEHNLNFGYSIADEVRKNLITLWNTYSFFVTYANLDGFDPENDMVPFDEYTNLDKWIISKMQKLINESDECYSTFRVFHLMKSITKFIDDLSNWYVRRSRRRFWRSENNIDKKAAYSALYQVLVDLIKIVSPIIPFVTEKMYQNLIVNKGSKESIHLCDFPIFNKDFYNEELINNIDSIISIVSLGRSARNRANIKNRQPLQKVFIYTPSSKNIVLDEISRQEILEELNIKECIFVDSADEIISYKIKPNFVSLKERFDSNMKHIIEKLNEISDLDKMKMINDGGIAIKLDENVEKISREDLLVDEISRDGISASSLNGIVVGVDTNISDKLIKEGIVRDLIRHIQNFRKESEFKVQDRIDVFIKSNNETRDAIEENIEYFKNEILAVSISYEVLNSKYSKKIELNGVILELGISISN